MEILNIMEIIQLSLVPFCVVMVTVTQFFLEDKNVIYLPFAFLIFIIVIKVYRISKMPEWITTVITSQVNFAIAYVLTALSCFFFYETAVITNQFSSSFIAIEMICLIMFAFICSLSCEIELISTQQYVVLTITFIYLIAINAQQTISVIAIADSASDKVPDNVKDTLILFCSTIIAAGILVMDILTEFYRERKEKMANSQNK